RKALVVAALVGSPVLLQIEWEGATWSFTVDLVQRLYTFGAVAPGKSALVALLEEVRKQVGPDRQASIDAMLPALARLPTAPASVATNDHGQEFVFPVESASKSQTQSPANLTQFRLGRIEEWSQSRYNLEKRFVNLTLLLDKGESEPQRWH